MCFHNSQFVVSTDIFLNSFREFRSEEHTSELQSVPTRRSSDLFVQKHMRKMLTATAEKNVLS